MGDRSTEQPVSLAELDARHDDLLSQLEALDERIQSVLKDHLPQKTAASLLPRQENEPTPPIDLPIEPSFGDPLVTYGGPGAPTY